MQNPLVLGVIVVLFLLSFTCSPADAQFPVYERGCFFSIGKADDGVYWFVDPNGDPFFFQGIDTVNPFGDVANNGQQPYKLAVEAKFDGNDVAWANFTAHQLYGWGFNAIGPFSNSLMFNWSVPYTIMLEVTKRWGEQSGNILNENRYDPGYITSIQATLELNAVPYINDPYLIGYFMDNELFFGSDWRATYSLLALYLNQTGGYGYKVAVNFLTQRYNNINNLNTAWDVHATSFDNLTVLWPFNNANPNYNTDSLVFQNLTVHYYFNLTTTMLKNVDPNHLLLGVKWGGTPLATLLQIDGQYDDVLSYDNYDYAQNPSQVYWWYANSGKPVLIGEFSFRANDSGLPNTKGAGVTPVPPTQAIRAQQFEVFVKNTSISPYLVGLSWFEWVDEPVSGTSTKENSNYGVVNLTDDVYVLLTNAMKETYPLLYDLHGDVSKARFTKTCESEAVLPCPMDCHGNGCCQNGYCICDSDYYGVDCSSFNGSFVDTFSTWNTDMWFQEYDYVAGQEYVGINNLQITPEGLELIITNSGCPSACASKNVSVGAFRSVLPYGYGTLEISMMLSNTLDETLLFQWGDNEDGSAWNSFTLSIVANGLQSKAQLSRWQNGGTGTYSSSVTLPYDPSTAFHTLTFVRASNGAYLAILADSEVLYNVSDIVPVGSAVFLLGYYSSTPPTNPNGMRALINSISFTTPTIKALCSAPLASSSTGIQASSSTKVASSSTTASASSSAGTHSSTSSQALSGTNAPSVSSATSSPPSTSAATSPSPSPSASASDTTTTSPYPNAATSSAPTIGLVSLVLIMSVFLC